jgi:hypothetical protein
MVGEATDKSPIILLGRIKVGMNERPTVAVAPGIDDFGILPAPSFQPLPLFLARRSCLSISGHNSGLEMIGQSQDQMNSPLWHVAREPLPRVARKYLHTVRKLPAQTSRLAGCSVSFRRSFVLWFPQW